MMMMMVMKTGDKKNIDKLKCNLEKESLTGNHKNK